jgi:beta-N-acetylhexosaminidase
MKHIITILFFLLTPLFFPLQLQELPVTDETFDPIPPEPTPEELILEEMTLEEKVGQLFIFGFDGTTLSKESKEFFQEIHLGGVLLLTKNITSETQLKQLTTQIQSTNNIPLFISIDQEGGVVCRIRWNSTLTKSQAEIDGPKEAYATAKSRGEMLKEYGINMNLAPVVEYITSSNSFMYNRVYRGDVEDIVEKSAGSVEGYTDAGIVSVPKHYPGHSNTSPDSHLSLPEVNISKDNWYEYIKPFRNILNQTTVDAMMVGHIKFPNMDSNAATLSSEILTKRLIEDLEYEGLIISDDMEMGALEDIDTYVNMAKRALNAGVDILIYSKYTNNNPTVQRDVYEYIVDLVEKGEMNIDDKVLKILRVKIKYNILEVEEE